MQKEILNYDVVIIGAGPAGITTAIKLKQLCQQHKTDLSIAIFEKGSSVGANIISGCVMDPTALSELIPNWDDLGFSGMIPVTQDSLYYLTNSSEFKLPNIKQWGNEGNFIISLSQLCIKLSEYAESLGVEVYSGFPIVDVVIENDSVVGVITSDAGLDRQSKPKSNYQPGIIVMAKQVILAEGCRGSVSKIIIKKFELDKGRCPQTYGLGIKEIWQIEPYKSKPGVVEHYLGYPLNNNAYGGGFLYHMDNNLVSIGLVTALDYKNPYLSPFEEFQKLKSHPKIKSLLVNGKRLEYGARAVVEGGVQALPKLAFPGGVIVGDSAGFINVPKIKGVHNAIKSGLLAAPAVFYAILNNQNTALKYEPEVRSSWLYKDLYRVRNIRPAFRLGLILGLLYAGFEHYILRDNAPWTFKWWIKDNEKLKRKTECLAIDYPKPDGIITFDKASSVHLANVQHDDTQPCHLRLKSSVIPLQVNLIMFAAPETRYCPAGVYEIINHSVHQPYLQINAQNCVHCKACDIKDPMQNITWAPPEAGSGPQYSDM